MYAVIRLRSSIKAKGKVEDTLKLLRLNRKMHCVLIDANDSYKGMLQKVKDLVTWGEVDEQTLKMLVAKRANENDGKDKLKIVFRLTPPSGGFRKSVKEHFPRGELGYRGAEINSLIKRMI